MLLRFIKFRRPILCRPIDGEGDDLGGGAPPAPPEPDQVDTSTPPDIDTAPADGGSKPASLLEAMFGAKPAETPEAKAERLRDEAGRFAKAPPAAPAAPGAQPPATAKTGTQPPAAPKSGDGKTDPTAMPEGLTPKAQERFQALANTNKELTSKVAEYEPIVSSARALQETFREHGVKREQFDQAMTVVGMMNRGDYQGALRVLDEQRALISMALGQPLPGADPLAKFPDLREDVDNLRMPEARAIEIARQRTAQAAQQQTQQREQQSLQKQQAEQEQLKQGQLAVDRFCAGKMKTDIDYPRIEALLIEQINEGLLKDIPPNLWSGIVEKTYALIKQSAGIARPQAAAPAGSVLRPSGGESPRQAPRSLAQAMWGKDLQA